MRPAPTMLLQGCIVPSDVTVFLAMRRAALLRTAAARTDVASMSHWNIARLSRFARHAGP